MKFRLLALLAAALVCACAAPPPTANDAAASACIATSTRPAADARIRAAVDEARRQHELFGGQTIDRDGRMFRVGHKEATWSRRAGDSVAAWERVATFWQALPPSEQPGLMTSAGWIAPADVAERASSDPAVREALLRAAIVDTPWSAAFISYLMKSAGYSADEFAFSDSHADYVRAALATSAAEAAGEESTHALRACDAATTPPRAGDLLCATRASTSGIDTFAALMEAMGSRPATLPFPMHCDLVVGSEFDGDLGLETIGGNVLDSVTLSRMTLDSRKLLDASYVSGRAPQRSCAVGGADCAQHLSRRPWVVVLQVRD